MRFAPYSLALCAGLGLLACSSSSATTTTIVRPQLLSVEPEDFLGAVRCRPDLDAGGGSGGAAAVAEATGELVVKSYVATLTDVTATSAEGGALNFVLPSSPPTPCTLPVTFSYLVTSHFYTAHIEAYTENAGQLAPTAPGSSLLVDSSGARVAAHWSADCGGYSPSPAGGSGGGGGSGGEAGEAGNAVSTGGDAAAGTAGTPGVLIVDTVTQTPHACGAGLVPIQ